MLCCHKATGIVLTFTLVPKITHHSVINPQHCKVNVILYIFREEDVLKKFAKLEQLKNEIRANAAKKLAAVEAAKVGTRITYLSDYVVLSEISL
jgi:hypothetical protein